MGKGTESNGNYRCKTEATEKETVYLCWLYCCSGIGLVESYLLVSHMPTPTGQITITVVLVSLHGG